MFNIYIFTGSVQGRVNIVTKNYHVLSSEDDPSFECQILAKSLRSALLIFKTIMSDYEYNLDEFYTVVNSKGKSSSRIIRHPLAQDIEQDSVVDRVVEEKFCLDEKIASLSDFIVTDSFRSLSQCHQNLLEKQLEAMRHYSYILLERLELFEGELSW